MTIKSLKSEPRSNEIDIAHICFNLTFPEVKYDIINAYTLSNTILLIDGSWL